MTSPYREESNASEVRALRRKVERMRHFLRHQIKGAILLIGIAAFVGCFFGTIFLTTSAIDHGYGDVAWRDIANGCNQQLDACRDDRDACREVQDITKLTDCSLERYAPVGSVNEAWIKRALKCEGSAKAAWSRTVALVDGFFSPRPVEIIFRDGSFDPVHGVAYSLGLPSAMWCDKLPKMDLMKFQAVYCIDGVGHRVEMTVGGSP